jgi:hypothetical protein
VLGQVWIQIWIQVQAEANMRRVESLSGRAAGAGARSLLLCAWAAQATLGCGSGDAERAAGALSPATAGGAAGSGSLPDAPAPGSGVPDENGELVLDELDDADAVFANGAISGEWFTYSDGTSPIVPPDHTGLGAIGGEAHVAGAGFSDWGAGLSAYFSSVDLTAFDGVRLRARGRGRHRRRAGDAGHLTRGRGRHLRGDGVFRSLRHEHRAR